MDRSLPSNSSNALVRLGHYGLFVRRILGAVLARGWSPAAVLEQAATIAGRCFLPVTLTMAPFGAVIGIQGMAILSMFSAERLLSNLLALFTVRELAPVIAAVLVAAQAGASFAAELGAMRIKEELDATEIMGVDPVAWHVVPRILAMVMVLPALTMIAAAVGLLGGYGVAVWMGGQSSGVFMAHLADNLTVFDLGSAMLKGAVYGLLIGTIACWRGYHVEGGAEGVGRAVNETVVLCVMYILVANYILSSLLFGAVGVA
jgi:phospholipid/cholesterol/gamma-HCH transport system permease protein